LTFVNRFIVWCINIVFIITVSAEVRLIHGTNFYDNSTIGPLIVTEGQSVKLRCYAGGVPIDTIKWMKSGVMFKYDDKPRYLFLL